MLMPEHPKYLPLSYGRFIRIVGLKPKIPNLGSDEALHIERACAWVICTRPAGDPELESALASEDPVAALKPLWYDSLHVREVAEFKEWYDAEFEINDAAATVAKATSGKKSAASAVPNPTT